MEDGDVPTFKTDLTRSRKICLGYFINNTRQLRNIKVLMWKMLLRRKFRQVYVTKCVPRHDKQQWLLGRVACTR